MKSPLSLPLYPWFSSRGRSVTATLLLSASLALAPAALSALDNTQARSMALGELSHGALELGLETTDLGEASISSVISGPKDGITHVYLQQRFQGLEVHNGVANVSFDGNGNRLAMHSRFVAGMSQLTKSLGRAMPAVEAISAAAFHLKMQPTEAFAVLSVANRPDEATTLSPGGLAQRPIEARLLWYPTPEGVRLAWRLEIETLGGDHWWHTFVDAETGEDLGRYDLIVHDSAEAIRGVAARSTAPAGAVTTFPSTDGSVYNVYPLPLESPSDGPRQLVTDVASPAASPFGWHDTDGAPGAEFTVTRGNNAHAYTDLDADNIPDPGSDPDGGPALNFDFPLDLTQIPGTYRPAAVTNLFYWNNIVHDITHAYGFDEASGNFQVNNYGNGGLGGDDVRAEAQDGSGINNANFGTPVDGSRPRMQMFEWRNPRPNIVTVNSGSAAGDYIASGANFGPTVAAVGPISADVTLVNDGAGASTSDACEPLVGFPAGDIALVDRGSCSFVLKAFYAQNAGAPAMLVVNNVAGNPITMGGAFGGITIPSAMISLADGNLVKPTLPFDATISADPVLAVNRDSDLDAGVIAHEYGHGISNRLTGGAGQIGCLSNAEQMGEGWSDWWTLTLTTLPSDTGTTPRGVGSYLLYQAPDGAGIRPTPYSTDLSVNPSSYASVADVANISQPHGIGYVWNTMLWEMYWNLVDRYGYNANVYQGASTGGNNLAIQLVMDGMKLQPCSPGFVDGRDAILTADSALTGGANQCEIWRAFAKRGLGDSADQGSSLNRTDGIEAFDLPASCLAAVFGGFNPPVSDAPAVNNRNAGSTVPLKFTLSGAGTSLIMDSQTVDCTTLVPTGEAPTPIDTSGIKVKSGDRFHLNWSTDSSWAGTCRRVTIRIPGASDAIAYFDFF